MLWSFDGSIQDADENVVLKSDHALEALEFAYVCSRRDEPVGVKLERRVQQPGLNAARRLHLELDLRYRTAQETSSGGGRYVLRAGTQGPRGTDGRAST